MDEIDFITESNRIEGILRPPTSEEIEEFERFMELEEVNVAEIQRFVTVYQLGAVLRDRVGLDVRVGNHYPPRGGPGIRRSLEELLSNDMAPFEKHIAYETLHPFTDGNGRSGRMLWAWQMQDISLGFLHKFYYQVLSSYSETR